MGAAPKHSADSTLQLHGFELTAVPSGARFKTRLRDRVADAPPQTLIGEWKSAAEAIDAGITAIAHRGFRA